MEKIYHSHPNNSYFFCIYSPLSETCLGQAITNYLSSLLSILIVRPKTEHNLAQENDTWDTIEDLGSSVRWTRTISQFSNLLPELRLGNYPELKQKQNLPREKK